MPSVRVWPGDPYPLGATWTGVGVNFALFSAHATNVELCLFDSRRRHEGIGANRAARADRHGLARLPARRAAGPALRLSRARPVRTGERPPIQSEQSCHGSVREIGRAYDSVGRRDVRLPRRRSRGRSRRSTIATTPPYAPLAAVVDPAFTWGDDRPPRTPWHNTVIYEMHVRGFSKLHPDVPERLRGTYEALTTEPALNHLKQLGVTAVELMPVHHHARDRHLEERGLTNYWGYNSFGYFAPERRFAASRHAGRRGARVQAHGARAARRRPRSHPRRRLQPHGRRQPPRARRCRCRASTTRRTTGSSPTIRATTWTSPAAATR